MVYVFRLGPVGIGGQDFYAFAGLDARGLFVAPEVGREEEVALSRLARRHTGPLYCEPDLGPAAVRFGFEPATFPMAYLRPRALLAFRLAMGQGKEEAPSSLDVLTRFFEAGAMLYRARPWDAFHPDAPLRVEATMEGVRSVREASVLGAGGEEFGLVLYDEPGTIRRVSLVKDGGKLAEAARLPATAVTFEREPRWAARAIQDGFGLPRVPVPIRVSKGAQSFAPGRELLVLAAALRALAGLTVSSDLRSSEVEVEAQGLSVSARVFRL